MAAATAVVLLGGSIAPFLAPPVVRFEQDRTGVSALTGFVADVLDRGHRHRCWAISFSGVATSTSGRSTALSWTAGRVLSDAERAHMRDVRKRVHRVLAPRARGRRGACGRVPAGTRRHGGEGRRVARGRERRPRARRRDRRRRRLRGRRVRCRVRGVPSPVLQRRQLHVRPGPRSARPALPGAVLVGDLDRRRRRRAGRVDPHLVG